VRHRVRIGGILVLVSACVMARPGIAADKLRDHILPSVPKDAYLVAYLPCSVLGPVVEVVCVVTEKQDTSKVNEPSRVLYFYRVERGGLKTILQYDAYNALDSIGMINEDTLLAVWVTGSAFQFTIFRGFGTSEIRQVLDVGGKSYPEVADLDGDGVPEVLITTWEYVVRKGKREFLPTKTSIYRLEKDKYKKTQVLPWQDRYRALQKPNP